MRKIIVMCLMVMAIAACTSLNCPVQNSVRAYYSLLKADGTPDTLGVDTLWLWTIRGERSDTLLNSLFGTKATSFDLPISHTQSEDTICLALMDTIGTVYLDTIRIKKENYPHFESVDCQASYFHTLTAVKSTHYLIDTVVINHSFVSYDTSNEHLLLYLKARR